jgi:hypothetical protein
MQSRPEIFTAYADKCDRRADAATDRRTKKLFRDLAFQWRAFAATTRALEANSKAMEDFFKRRSSHPDGSSRYLDF